MIRQQFVEDQVLDLIRQQFVEDQVLDLIRQHLVEDQVLDLIRQQFVEDQKGLGYVSVSLPTVVGIRLDSTTVR